MKSLKVFTTMAPMGMALTAMAAAAQVPTVWVIGDSTASNVNHRGWADPFGDYFDQTKARTVNRARAGRSSRTFITEGLWEKVRAELKPGDYVLIQFGHNDGSAPDKDRARGSLPGLGDESKEFTLPNGSQETVYTFGHYVRRMIDDPKAAGALPVVLSLTVRNIWKEGKVERGNGQFSKWSSEIAKSARVPFADVTNAIADQYDKLGEVKVKAWFPEDHTHTSPEGADFTASLVVACLKGIDSPLAAFLSAKGLGVEKYPAGLATAGPAAARAARPETADALSDRRFDGAQRTRRRLQRTVGLGRAAGGSLRYRQGERGESRGRRVEQPHVPHPWTLGQGARHAQAGRRGDDAVRT